MCVHTCMLVICLVMCVEVREQCLGVSALFPTCGAGDPTQVVRPGRIHCYPLNHFMDALLGSFKDYFRDFYYVRIFKLTFLILRESVLRKTRSQTNL